MREIAPHVTVDPGILGGKPVIKGTRVPVEVLVGHVAAGDPIERVAEEYKLTREDILAALAFASRIVADQRITVMP